MNETVPFAALRSLLMALGFTVQVTPGAYIIGEHVASGCKLFYPPMQDTDSVSPTHLAATRRFLDEFGVLDRAKFEEQLHRAVLAG